MAWNELHPVEPDQRVKNLAYFCRGCDFLAIRQRERLSRSVDS